MEADITLDYCGLKCPMPIIRLSQEMPKLPLGSIIKVLATDITALKDIQAWAKANSQEILAISEQNGLITAIIRKSK